MAETCDIEWAPDPAALTTPIPSVDATLQLSARTVAWLDDRPHVRRLVCSVWDKLADLERAGHNPGAIAALRFVLIHHQPPTPVLDGAPLSDTFRGVSPTETAELCAGPS